MWVERVVDCNFLYIFFYGTFFSLSLRALLILFHSSGIFLPPFFFFSISTFSYIFNICVLLISTLLPQTPSFLSLHKYSIQCQWSPVLQKSFSFFLQIHYTSSSLLHTFILFSEWKSINDIYTLCLRHRPLINRGVYSWNCLSEYFANQNKK